jgi:hypothetical protein
MVPIQHIRGIGAVLAWLAYQPDRRRGGAARSPDQNASPRVAIYRQMGRIKSST